MKSPATAGAHRSICAREKCEYLDRLDYADPCVACPNGHFGIYSRALCNGGTGAVASQSPLGPGSIFSLIIRNLTGAHVATCSRCTARMAQMNAWGWWRCWRERDTISAWLIQEASLRGHVIERNQMLGLFKAALKELKQTA